MNNGIVKVVNTINPIENFQSATIIGDPGCDGLGAATMSVFAKALTAVHSDFTMIVGDIVHRGIKPLYAAVSNFVNAIAPNPVYMLCGNHDTAFYDEYFGLRNYLLYNDKCLFIVLDNSTRNFSDDALSFLKSALKEYDRKNIVILFHYPAPNSICTNSINPEDWKHIDAIIGPYKERIRYFICGHIHSYYEDMIGETKLLVTGGGGARIEYVNEKIDPLKAHHHIVQLHFDKNDILQYRHIPLQTIEYTAEIVNGELKKRLEQALTNESVAHVKYKLFATDAQEKGYPGIAKMFRAFSDSEFFHAKNHLFILNSIGSIQNNLKHSHEQESHEINVLYKEFIDYCDKHHFGLARYAFFDSFEAEQVHERLVSKVISTFQDGLDIPETEYHTCTSCGYSFVGETKPKHCPVCGAPSDRIRSVD
jgi:rubrerythrin